MTQITLATLAEATPQQVFDQAVLGVLRQGMRSWDCDAPAYRDNHGNASPAGHLMTSEEYESLESVWGSDPLWIDLAEMNGVPRAHWKLITELENAHSYNGEACMDRQTTGGAVLDAATETDAHFVEMFRAAVAAIAQQQALSFDNIPPLAFVVETEESGRFSNIWTGTGDDNVEVPLSFASVGDALDEIAEAERLELAAGMEPRRVRIAIQLAAVGEPKVTMAVAEEVETETDGPRP